MTFGEIIKKIFLSLFWVWGFILGLCGFGTFGFVAFKAANWIWSITNTQLSLAIGLAVGLFIFYFPSKLLWENLFDEVLLPPLGWEPKAVREYREKQKQDRNNL